MKIELFGNPNEIPNSLTYRNFEILLTDDELYSYMSLALLGLSFIKQEKKSSTGKTTNNGLYYDFVDVIRKLVRSRMSPRFSNFDPRGKRRVILGTLYWGKKSTIPNELKTSPFWDSSLGKMKELLEIWPSKIQSPTNPPDS
jgi:hypothetical protein